MQGHLFRLFKTGDHFPVHGIHAAAADTVMGMILHQRFPAVGQQIMGIFHSPLISHCRQRLGSADKQGFTAGVHLLQVDTRRCRIRQRVPAVGFLAAQLSLDHRQILSAIFLQALEIIHKIGMDEIDIRVQPGSGFQRFRQVGLHWLMVTAVHEQKLVRGGKLQCPRQLALPVFPCLLRFCGHLHTIIVPIGKQHPQDQGTVRGFPEHFRILGGKIIRFPHFIIKTGGFYASSEGGAVDPRIQQYLGRLSHISEGIGKIPHLTHISVSGCLSHTGFQIAQIGFASGQPFILEDVPGACIKPFFPDQLFHQFPFFRTYLKIIIQHNRLSVQMEAPEIRIRLQRFQKPVHKLHLQAMVLLIRQIPLPVPMGMGNHMGLFFHFPRSSFSLFPPNFHCCFPITVQTVLCNHYNGSEKKYLP